MTKVNITPPLAGGEDGGAKYADEEEPCHCFDKNPVIVSIHDKLTLPLAKGGDGRAKYTDEEKVVKIRNVI